MRAVSILRVVLVHVFVRFETTAFVVFTFVLPGMPTVFAVSGALSYAALTKPVAGARASFWRSRARRLLLPFWAYAAVALALLLLFEARSQHEWYRLEHSTLWCWALPIVQPAGSPGLKALALHLWFMPPFLFLLGTAPLTVWLHQRLPGLGLALFAAAAGVVELNRIPIPDNLRTTLAFGIAFQAGFLLSDGRLARAPAALLAGASLALFAAGFAWHRQVLPGGQLNPVILAHVLIGLSYLPLWQLAREPVQRAFRTRWLAAATQALNRRAYTLFLWGPGATDLGWRIARRAPESLFLATYLASTALLLVSVAWLFGRVEDRAAGRQSSSATSRCASSAT